MSFVQSLPETISMGKELSSIGNVTKVMIFERKSWLSFQRMGIDELQRIRVKLDLDEVIIDV